MRKCIQAALPVAAGLLLATAASAQVAPNPLFPYPGQCQSGQAGSACASIPAPQLLIPLPFVGQPVFQYELAQPVGYFPDQTNGQDYYEIAYSAAKGFQKLAELGIFPNPNWPGGVPDGFQWTGIIDPATGAPLLTPVWGYEQKNMGGGPLTLLTGVPVSSWPGMNIAATRGTNIKVKWLNETPDQHLTCPYPQAWDQPCAIDRSVQDPALKMGFMGTQFMSKSGIIPPNAPKVCQKGAGEANHPQSGLSCLTDADCPAGSGETCSAEAVTPFGGAMQVDNAVVPHLHGGNIPPGSDGFAEKMFGNVTTAAWYNPGVPWPSAEHPCDATCTVKAGFTGSYCLGNAVSCRAVDENGDTIGWPLDPGFDVGNNITPLFRPLGNNATYNYPIHQEAATIWYHDHALGKTRINVIAGPAGFFPVTDPAPGSVDAMLAGFGLSDPTGLATCYTVNPGPPVTASFNGGACRDRYIALQDRAFNNDGTINYPNGLGQPPIPPIQPGNVLNAVGGAVTPAFNPSITPQWVPEYFGDMPVVNGVIWPKATVYPSVYRLRLLGGANSRCWLLGLQAGKTALPFFVIADEQGYLADAKATPALTICPGERYEALVDFRALPAGTRVVMTNAGGAPFPNGVTPQAPRSPFAGTAQVMAFSVVAAPAGAVDPTAALPGNLNRLPIDPTFAAKSYTQLNPAGNPKGAIKACLPAPGTPGCGTLAAPQWHYLNEVLNPVTGAPERVRIDGKSFEDALLQTQPLNGFQVWEIVNTTVDAHPMHLHLVKLQIINRQPINTKKYLAAVTVPGQANPSLTPVDPTPYLMGTPVPPAAGEMGFKDTAVSFPGEVMRIIAWWGGEYPQAPAGTLPDNVTQFAPVTNGPYVWHCHIVDHEDREMMRPTLVQ